MKLSVQTVLDRLEPKFTDKPKRWADKPPPRWIARLRHDTYLQPTEHYSWWLFFRLHTWAGVSVVVILTVTQAIIWGCLWHQYPFLFTDKHYHKLMIGLLSHEGMYQLPWMYLFLLAFNYALHLPGRYFWNRRAARLLREPVALPAAPIVGTIADPSIWPPAPIRPALK